VFEDIIGGHEENGGRNPTKYQKESLLKRWGEQWEKGNKCVRALIP